MEEDGQKPKGVLGIFDSIKDRGKIQKELKRGFFNLQFPPEIESVFLDYYFNQSLSLIKVSIVLSLIIYSLFGILDVLTYKEFLGKIWIIRYGIGCPVIVLASFLIRYAKKEKHVQLILSLAALIIGLTIIMIMIVTRSDPAQKYYAGLVLTTFYAYIALGLRFKYASTVGISLIVIYFLLSILYIKPLFSFLVGNAFTLVFANIIGMIGNYLSEKNIRINFLLSALANMDREGLKRLNKTLEKLSKTDSLTGLANRRYFEEFLGSEWKRATRYKYPISLLMIDIDHFKRYNDYWGHQKGDQCLVKLAEVLKEFGRRPGDLVARYGGEEFVVILSNTPSKHAEEIAETIRKKIINLNLSHPLSDVLKVVTVSIGVATVVPSKEKQKDKLIEMSDKVLYEAKSRGRNKVVIKNIDYIINDEEAR